MKSIGFTGAQRGMSPRQKKAIAKLAHRLNPQVVHLGDCVGADDEMYEIAILLGCATIGHPPTEGGRRAFRDYNEEREPKPFLERNYDIAMEGEDGLIAAPEGFIEELRSGTWSTVRRARKLGRRIWIVKPDGTTIEEGTKP